MPVLSRSQNPDDSYFRYQTQSNVIERYQREGPNSTLLIFFWRLRTEEGTLTFSTLYIGYKVKKLPGGTHDQRHSEQNFVTPLVDRIKFTEPRWLLSSQTHRTRRRSTGHNVVCLSLSMSNQGRGSSSISPFSSHLTRRFQDQNVLWRVSWLKTERDDFRD